MVGRNVHLHRTRYKLKRPKRKAMLQHVMRVVLGAAMILAGVGHLTFQRQEFLAQVPRWLPNDVNFMGMVVLASGVVEIGLGVAMVVLRKQRVQVGLALGLFFVLIFPGNISQYTNGISAFGLDTDTKRLVRLFFQPVMVLWALWSTGALAYLRGQRAVAMQVGSFYEIEAALLNGQMRSMEAYKGKTVIVVNTASKCGLTPQYEGLETLYKKYKDRGLVILGFPCNQFGQQERGGAEEIAEFCSVNYGVSFPMYGKVEVNGSNTHPVFGYLKGALGGVLGSDIKWNFTKFVIDKTGKPVKRYAPTTKPEQMEAYLQTIL